MTIAGGNAPQRSNISFIRQTIGAHKSAFIFVGIGSQIRHAHLNDLPVKFSVCVNEGQDKLPTMYWLPKLHKRPYKARFANSSSCTTTELSKLLTSCLTAIKSHVIRYCETVYETSNKIGFGQ